MILTILAIGKKKSQFGSQIQEYKKRIVAPFSLEVEILEKEEKIIPKIKKGDFVIALDERGREYSTVEFSKLIEVKLNESVKRIVFIIGGAYGLDEKIKSQSTIILRIGKMTLPHELARLVIAEQLYRVTNLISGGKYHHE